MISIESALASQLKRFGFVRRRRTWWRSTDFAIQVVNLQRGFGEHLHINLGVYLRLLGDELTPPENHCHIRARLERVCPTEFFEAVRSLEAQSAPAPEVLEALAKYGVTWLDTLSAKQGMCSYLALSEANTIFVHSAAKELCHVNFP